MWTNEQYEAKKAERARKRQEDSKKPWWWLKQTDPVARFTLYLAIFTFVLICISVAQWGVLRGQQIVMQGQLDAMERDQRPFMWLSSENIPKPAFFQVPPLKGQIIWDYRLINFGKSYAHNVTFNNFIKVGNSKYRRSYGVNGPNFGGDVPPNNPLVSTVISAPIISNDDYKALLGESGSISILVELQYSDEIGKIYTGAVCMSRLNLGAIALIDPATCEKEGN